MCSFSFFITSYFTSSVCHDSFGPSTVAKGGGKAFDIEVDIKDPYAFDLLESVNEITKNQREIMEVISAVRSSITFFFNILSFCGINIVKRDSY